MLFNSAQFFVFFGVVLALFYGGPRSWRRPLLLAASYVFYASWNWKFVPLLLSLTLVDYACATWVERTTDPTWRRRILVLGLAANLGFLGFFKYFNFFAELVAEVIRRDPHSFMLSIVLPLGISFHTFQSMSYLIDVYRGQQKAIRSLLDYALFIAFFPQLVAGPIVRAREFFVDLLDWKPPSTDEQSRGMLGIALGLVKKVVLADQCAVIADAYFADIAGHPGAVAAWTGTAAFAMQIFFDFSGYTDMAIGLALLLGFRFPENFRRPYLAFSITDFWHRWHMSLSRWLRDYLYVSLGGNRHGSLATYRNLLLTMLLGGLWHGASWNFIVWGGYHGTLLATERALGRRIFSTPPHWALYPLRVVVTFALVCIGWVFFRAATLQDSLTVLSQMFSAGEGTVAVPPWLVALIALSLILAFVEERRGGFERLAQGASWAYVMAVVTMLFVVELVGVTDRTVPFVYFQF
jgi:alginate O-acetyltransferase complex protein AlgI